jgi:hypothetical protein
MDSQPRWCTLLIINLSAVLFMLLNMLPLLQIQALNLFGFVSTRSYTPGARFQVVTFVIFAFFRAILFSAVTAFVIQV